MSVFVLHSPTCLKCVPISKPVPLNCPDILYCLTVTELVRSWCEQSKIDQHFFVDSVAYGGEAKSFSTAIFLRLPLREIGSDYLINTRSLLVNIIQSYKSMASQGLKHAMRMAGQRYTALSMPCTTQISRSWYVLPENTLNGQVDHQVRWANLKAISDRMRSVGSVGKITKAMKMVAAAKLRSVQSLQENSRPFAVGLQQFFSTMDRIEDSINSYDAAKISDGSRSRFVIAVTSDRGLCGGVNSSVVKKVKSMTADDNGTRTAIMLLGDKGRDGLARAHGNEILVSFKDVFKSPVTFPQVCVIAEDILNRDYDEIVLVFNQFKSVISQEVVRKPIVGLKALMAGAEAFDEYEFDSDMDSAQVLVDLFEFQLATQIFNALLENATSEQAARMSAMDNASRNASDMLQTLTLSYNRQRQAAITQELSEITSGAAALE